ncbi:uncharacterized protein LOC117590036 isoform X3 [Drosophila guanche]|uniref:uncharacterized protein LOC117590036 isoform X3 n=1 Tax=Drosophila guanche TaxID=7266 RepID=UPI0014724353|nr:uncharacterized protein LOC117590036 isoform X3 [Drosophila guanche]
MTLEALPLVSCNCDLQLIYFGCQVGLTYSVHKSPASDGSIFTTAVLIIFCYKNHIQGSATRTLNQHTGNTVTYRRTATYRNYCRHLACNVIAMPLQTTHPHTHTHRFAFS